MAVEKNKSLTDLTISLNCDLFGFYDCPDSLFSPTRKNRQTPCHCIHLCKSTQSVRKIKKPLKNQRLSSTKNILWLRI
jgi:hypothetical protein